MNTVKVGELKTHLSAYLKQVQNGQKIIVLDRSRPVAEIVPLKNTMEKRLVMIIPAKRSWNTLKLKPLPRKIKVDIMKLLEEEREDR